MAKSVKTGANLAFRALSGGSIGGKSYQQYLAMMGGTEAGTNGPTLKKVAAFVASNLAGLPWDRALVKAFYLRSGERGGNE